MKSYHEDIWGGGGREVEIERKLTGRCCSCCCLVNAGSFTHFHMNVRLENGPMSWQTASVVSSPTRSKRSATIR